MLSRIPPRYCNGPRIYNSRGNEAFRFPNCRPPCFIQLEELTELTAVRNRNAMRLIEAHADIETLIGLRQIISSQIRAGGFPDPSVL